MGYYFEMAKGGGAKLFWDPKIKFNLYDSFVSPEQKAFIIYEVMNIFVQYVSLFTVAYIQANTD